MTWITDLEKETATSDYGLEVVNGMEYKFKIDLSIPPSTQIDNYEGNESKKWLFVIDLLSADIVDELDLNMLARDNQKKYDRVTSLKTGPNKLKLSKAQTSQFIAFVKQIDIPDGELITVKMQRTGAAVKTKYHFEVIQ